MLVHLVAVHMRQLPSIPCDVAQLARRGKLSVNDLALIDNIDFDANPTITEVNDLVGLYEVSPDDTKVFFENGLAQDVLNAIEDKYEDGNEDLSWHLYAENLQNHRMRDQCSDQLGVSGAANRLHFEPVVAIANTSLPWALVMFALDPSGVYYQVITSITPPVPFTTTIGKESKDDAAISWNTFDSYPPWVSTDDLGQALSACNPRNDHNEPNFIFFEQVVNNTKDSSGLLQLQYPDGAFCRPRQSNKVNLTN